MDSDPFNPTFRKIGRGDVLLGTPPTPAAPPSTPPLPASAASPECPGCGGTGWYLLKVPYGDPRWGTPQPCECQDGRPTPRQVVQLARLAKELGGLAESTFENFNLDRGLDERHIWQDQPIAIEVQRQALRAAYLAALDYSARLDGWLYLYGSYGSGKSHLAAAIVSAAARRGRAGAYASVPRLLNYVKDGYGDNTAGERMRALISADVLVLDDLGTEAVSPSNRELLFDLLNERDESRRDRPTIITSNTHYDDPRFAGQVADRIAGMLGPNLERLIVLPVSSYRRRK